MWAIVALLCVLLEIGHPGLFLFLSFSIGALASTFSALVFDSLVRQCVVFLIASMVALIALIKWVKADKEYPHQKTNTQALIGRRALVVKDIGTDSPGEVKIGGELWMARGSSNYSIEAGTHVRVVQVSGAHVVVEIIR